MSIISEFFMKRLYFEEIQTHKKVLTKSATFSKCTLEGAYFAEIDAVSPAERQTRQPSRSSRLGDKQYQQIREAEDDDSSAIKEINHG